MSFLVTDSTFRGDHGSMAISSFIIGQDHKMSDGVVTIETSRDTQANAAPDECQWLEITRRIQEGDANALGVFYSSQFDMIFRYVQNIIGPDEQTCLDIVQETMLKVIRYIKPLGDQESVIAWTRAVTKSVTYDWLRKQKRRRHISGSTDNLADPTDREAIENAARLLWLEEEFQSLSPDLRSLLALRYRLGWSLKRIGERLGLKTGAVDGRIRRAIEKLQAKAEREFDE